MFPVVTTGSVDPVFFFARRGAVTRPNASDFSFVTIFPVLPSPRCDRAPAPWTMLRSSLRLSRVFWSICFMRSGPVTRTPEDAAFVPLGERFAVLVCATAFASDFAAGL